MPKDYPSVILPPIWREAIEMPPVYPSSAPLVCFHGYKKEYRYTLNQRFYTCVLGQFSTVLFLTHSVQAKQLRNVLGPKKLDAKSVFKMMPVNK